MKRILLLKKDVEIQAYKASGPGGQHRNKTETAIRMIHIPTGTVAQSCSERSKSSNLETCWKLLQAKLDKLVSNQNDQEAKHAWQQKPDASFGFQIRTYFLDGKHQEVIDHRSNATITLHEFKTGKIDKLLLARAQ